MDIPRPSQAKAKRRKRIVIGASIALVLTAAGVALHRLSPAAPTVDKNLVWIDTVKRGEMLREVRGLGTLVPEDIRWIAARTQGRVDRIVLRPGAKVDPESVILVLSNPSVEQASADAEGQLASAEAELTSLKVKVQSDLLQEESAAATAKAQYEEAKLKAAVNADLFKDGLVSSLELQLSKVTADQSETLNGIEEKKLAFARESIKPQLAVQIAKVEQLRAQFRLRREEMADLHVKAGMTGVLQLLPVDVGAQVEPGANLARVADPNRLKAEVRIAETQAKDVQIGEPASIDTRNGVVLGRVARIDPSVQNGTVTVDVTLTEALPPGARPDLSVDGTIQLERLADVVYVGRPAFGQEKSTVGIFRLNPNDSYANRIKVRLGRSSVNTVEIESGLTPGDRVILSDMSAWDANDRIRLN